MAEGTVGLVSVSDFRSSRAHRQVTHLRHVWPLTVPIAFLMAIGWDRRWVFEDAFLNFRIVEQIHAGNGPVFNVGQRVEAATSTLWLALLVTARTVLPFAHIEYLAIIGGLVLSGLGIWWAQRGAISLWDPDGSALAMPFGILLVVALPASWDWATGGLENGLSLAWIGAMMAVIGRLSVRSPGIGLAPTIATGVLVGLGPLVRPDLAVLSVAGFVAVCSLVRPRGRSMWALIGGFVALPVAYEVFRAGYYGTLVPNTALAKDAGGTYWHEGWNYLLDLIMPYWLAVPLVLVLVTACILFRGEGRPPVVALLALPVGGLVHALFITKSGGDYLHARLLLPSLFALVAPMAAIPVRRRTVVPLLAVGAWALVAILSLRVGVVNTPYLPVDDRGLAEGRRIMQELAVPDRRPILASDFRMTDGPVARRLQAQGKRALVSAVLVAPLLDVTPDRTTLVSVTSGISGYRAGIDVIVHEPQGLADPVGSRMRAISGAPAGHRKRETAPWIVALTTRPGFSAGQESAVVDAARRALSCGALREVMLATEAPLTLGRATANLLGSVGRTRLVVPRNPAAAAREFCGSPTAGAPGTSEGRG